MSQTRKQTSRYFYLLAAAIAVVGIPASIYQGCGAAVESVASMDRFAVPGEKVVELPGGDQTIFYESNSVLAGAAHSGPATPDRLVCQVYTQAGDALQVGAPAIDESYEVGGYRGRAAWGFTAPGPGRYRIRCAHPDPDAAMVVAVGTGFSVGDLLVAILGVTFSMMIAIIISLAVFLRRRGQQRQT